MDEEKRLTDEEKTFDLLSRAGQGLVITTRDDQNDFMAFLDTARMARRNNGRLRLVDTGRFSTFELEWLGEAGADLYTSDEARPSRSELGLLAKSCARGDAVIAYFHHGELSGDSGEASTSPVFLAEAGRDGVDIHLTNRERLRDLSALAEIAHVCRGARSRLVYYHHGAPDSGLYDLARSGGWIHLSVLDFPSDGERMLLADISAEAAASGSGLVIHVERPVAAEIVRDLFGAGAFLLFKTPSAGRGSRLRRVEDEARKRRLDSRSYYLHAFLLP